jgi:hypothetical protein
MRYKASAESRLPGFFICVFINEEKGAARDHNRKPLNDKNCAQSLAYFLTSHYRKIAQVLPHV